jgi:hypothetical protein
LIDILAGLLSEVAEQCIDGVILYIRGAYGKIVEENHQHSLITDVPNKNSPVILPVASISNP